MLNIVKGVARSVYEYTGYNMHYTSANVILVFHVQYIIMNM